MLLRRGRAGGRLRDAAAVERRRFDVSLSRGRGRRKTGAGGNPERREGARRKAGAARRDRGQKGASRGALSRKVFVYRLPRLVRLYLHRRRADRAARQKAAIQAQPLPPLRIGAPGLAYRGHHGGEH